LKKLKGLDEKLGKIDYDEYEKARQTAIEKVESFPYVPDDYLYTMRNLSSDFNGAIYGLDPSVITLESGFSLLVLQYLEYQTMFDMYKAVPSDRRYEYREQNPEVDANLFFWGYLTTLQSDTALNLVEQMIEQYGVPEEALPNLEKVRGEVEKPKERIIPPGGWQEPEQPYTEPMTPERELLLDLFK